MADRYIQPIFSTLRGSYQPLLSLSGYPQHNALDALSRHSSGSNFKSGIV